MHSVTNSPHYTVIVVNVNSVMHLTWLSSYYRPVRNSFSCQNLAASCSTREIRNTSFYQNFVHCCDIAAHVSTIQHFVEHCSSNIVVEGLHTSHECNRTLSDCMQPSRAPVACHKGARPRLAAATLKSFHQRVLLNDEKTIVAIDVSIREPGYLANTTVSVLQKRRLSDEYQNKFFCWKYKRPKMIQQPTNRNR